MSYLPSVMNSHQPRDIQLNGTSGYQINGNRVVINIDEIASNRSQDNLSGTLAIELWALAQPYQGSQFNGVCLAATQIGELHGDHFLSLCSYDLAFNEPQAGTWNICLMLREWDNGVFVTRDFINFPALYVAEAAPQARSNVRVTREESNNVINVAFSEKSEAPVATPITTDVPKGMDEVIAKKPVAKTTTAPTAKSTVSKTTEAAKTSAATKASAVTAKAAEKSATNTALKTETADTRVSINNASLRDLEAIKGVSKKLAKSIVDGRPYKQLEDLLNVKGMGRKLLDKIRALLKV